MAGDWVSEVIGGNPVRVHPTVSLAAYSAGDALGGLLTVASIGVSSSKVVLYNIVIADPEGVNPTGTLFLFNEPLTSAVVDNGAVSLNDADIHKIVGIIPVALADYYSIAGKSVAEVKVNGGSIHPDNTYTIYAIFILDGAATFSSADAFSIYFGFV